MDKDLNTLCYIREQVSYVEDYKDFDYKVIERKNRFFVIFDAVLQSFGVMNRNRRMYMLDNVWNCIQNDECIQDMLANNSWMGEMDHPAPELQDTELTMLRVATPNLGLTSHYIRKPRIDGSLLRATIQTDSGTDAGMNLATKIVDGGIRPAFSARVLGEMDPNNSRPVVNVRRLITYDWVLFPSHKEARADFKPSALTESVKQSISDVEKYTGATIVFFPELARMVAENEKASQFVCESFDLNQDDIIGFTKTGNSVVLKENNNIYIAPISNSVVKKKASNAIREYFGGAN